MTITAAVTFQDSEEGRSYKVWLVPEDRETDGDDRFILGPVGWRDGRLPFAFSDVEGQPHEEARHVGNLDNLRREERDGVTWVVADLDWDEDELALEARRLVDEGRITGVSIHPTDGEGFMVCGLPDQPSEDSIREAAASFDWETCENPKMAVIGMVIGSATLLMLPAFAEAEVEAVSASVSGAVDLPVASRDRAWNSSQARSRMFGDGETPDFQRARRGHLFVMGEGDKKGDYKLPFADVIDGELTIVPKGVFATAGGRGVDAVAGMSDADRSAVKSRICSLYDKVREEGEDLPCPFEESEAVEASVGEIVTEFIDVAIPAEVQAVTFSPAIDSNGQAWPLTTGFASVTVNGQPVQATLETTIDLYKPPGDWFTDPELDGPTPLTVTEDGRVFGHLALWDSCHRGFDGVCVTPPRDMTNYEEFHANSRVQTDQDELLPVGCLTVDVSHADVRASASSARRHYDHSGTVAAYVRAGDDAYGVWVAGAIRPDLDDGKIELLRRLSLSGDWRPRGREYFLLAAQAVPVPGFPVRARVASGVQTELTTIGPANHYQAVEASLEYSDLALVAAALGKLTDKVEELLEEKRQREFSALVASFEDSVT